MAVTFITSLARIGDFDTNPASFEPVPRAEWDTGDYVLAELRPGASVPYAIEHHDGRMVEAIVGDRLIGALGRRAATLQIVGDWADVGADMELETLTAAGVLGRSTSVARPRPPIARLRYLGHAHRDGERVTMAGSVGQVPDRHLDAPVVLLTGTSMDAGKTVAGMAVVRSLKRRGLRVVGTKLTGVGRYKDVLAFGDAGADELRDFVDAGLPSSAVDPARYREVLRILLAQIAELEPDVVVAEAGASPLEPYNGDTAIEMLGDRVRCTILSASDPYAVAGVIEAFGRRPDLVSGRATSTSAAVELVDRLTGLPALNLLDPASAESLDELLAARLALR